MGKKDCKSCCDDTDCVDLCRLATSRNDFAISYTLREEDATVSVPLDADEFFVIADGATLKLNQDQAPNLSTLVVNLSDTNATIWLDKDGDETVTVAPAASRLFVFGPEGWVATLSS